MTRTTYRNFLTSEMYLSYIQNMKVGYIVKYFCSFIINICCKVGDASDLSPK